MDNFDFDTRISRANTGSIKYNTATKRLADKGYTP